MFLCMLCNNQNSSDASCPWPHFKCPNIIAFQVTTSYDGILLDNLPASFRLPHFAYRSTELFPTKTWDLQPLWEICSWTHRPSSSATMRVHAFNIPHKSNEVWQHTFLFRFVEIVPVHAAPTHIWHVPISSRRSQWPYLEIASCWTHSPHPPVPTICVHIEVHTWLCKLL